VGGGGCCQNGGNLQFSFSGRLSNGHIFVNNHNIRKNSEKKVRECFWTNHYKKYNKNTFNIGFQDKLRQDKWGGPEYTQPIGTEI